MPSHDAPTPRVTGPRRWPWLLVVVLIGAVGFAVLAGLRDREMEARRGETRATLFATELHDTVREITLFGHAVPAPERARAVRPVIAGTTLIALRRIAELDAAVDDDPGIAQLRRQLDDIGRAALRSSDPVRFEAQLVATSARMAATANAIAGRQNARAHRLGQETVAGGAIILVVVLLLIVGLLQRLQRLLLTASERHADELRELAEIDELTGLGNRRRLGEDLEHLAAEATAAAPVQVLLLDLDGFKALNDSLGHAAGDSLLAAFAQRLSSAVADDGRAYRLGGDEFCVISHPGRDLAGAVHTAAARAHGARSGAPIASVGLALWPGEAPTSSAAMHLADDRMYAAKAERRGTRRTAA